MNQTEWKKSSNFKGKWFWKNKANKLLRSRVYNQDPNAKVIHHLRDTEEQRAYNDTYYEFWGFNQDGTFEYGKYVIFVTKEWHSAYHSVSSETRDKISTTLKQTFSTPEQMELRSALRQSEWNDDRRTKYSEMLSGENNPMYGTHASEETRQKLRIAHLGKEQSESSKAKRSQSLKAYYSVNPVSAERRRKIGEANKLALTGRHLSQEHKLNVSKSLIGHSTSLKTRSLISDANKCRSDVINDSTFKLVSDQLSLISSTENESIDSIKRLKSMLYARLKALNLNLRWNEFCHIFRLIQKDSY